VSLKKNKNNILLVWDSNMPTPKSVSTILLWKGGVVNESETCISLSKIIESDSENLRAEYLSLVYTIGETVLKSKTITEHLKIRDNLSYWWLTLIAEKSVYKTNGNIEDSIRLLCLMKWISNKSFDEIELVTSNQNLIKSFELWSRNIGLKFKPRVVNVINKYGQIVKWVVANTPCSVKAIVLFIHHLSDRWELKGVGLERWGKSTSRKTFVSYSANCIESDVRKGIFSSRYWTKIPQLLKESECESNWLHIFEPDSVIDSPKSFKELINVFNFSESACQNHVALETFLSWSVVKKTLVDWVQVIIKSRVLEINTKNFKGNDFCFWPLFMDVWRETIYGWSALEVLLRLNLFEVALKGLQRQNICVYLQENQSWEMCLLTVWERLGHGQTIGVPHSTVRFWDLRYFYDPRCYGVKNQLSLPQPNKIACNGKMVFQSLAEAGYPVKMLIEVEALRYLYLSTAQPLNENPNRISCLLVVTDYVLEKTQRQIAMLVSALKSLEESFEIIIKPHPLCPVVLEKFTDGRVTIKKDSL
jgi:surface carbohydrate biosynthesis protein (TIGR04326 family)